MTVDGRAIADPAPPDMSHDLVVIVPGIMGSELADGQTGETLWGLRDQWWYVRAWSTGSGLAALRLTDDERHGRYGRVKPVRLLRFPAFARIFAGFEPYHKLVATVRGAAAVPDLQVVEFPYDWRLPVAHNAKVLAERIAQGLFGWRSDPRHDEVRRMHPTGRPAQVVILAHSMGGLLARYLSLVPGATDDVRTVLTLGTPFYGSVKAAMLLNTGRGAPLRLPARRPLTRILSPSADEGVRRLAASLPGVHDLLPGYRCLHEGPAKRDPGRQLSVSDAVAIGADPDLVAAAFVSRNDVHGVAVARHRCLVGTAQPTPQSLSLSSGVLTTHQGLWVDQHEGGVRWMDAGGDGTVYRGSATLPSAAAAHTYLPQQHGPLAQSDEACGLAHALITEQDLDRLGPPLAAGELGLDLPDLAAPNEEFTATISGIDRPRDAVCRVTHPISGATIAVPSIEARDGLLCAVLSIDQPGLYRVEIAGGGFSPVRQMVLVADPDLADGDGS